MAMPSLKRDWTIADLANLPEDGQRYEVLDGELYVTPSPNADHQAAVQALYRMIAEYLDREPIAFAFVAPGDVMFSPRRLAQPDLFVVPLQNGRRPRSFADVKQLLLAVEVISPSSSRADRVAKRTVYREEGVEVYWVVDLDARTFERSVPSDPRVEVLADSIEWHPAGASQPLSIDLEEYFRRVLDA